MIKEFVLMIFFILLFLGLVNAEISNVYTEPQYPNLSSNIIKICADFSNVSYSSLSYKIAGDSEIDEGTIFLAPFSGKCSGVVNYNPLDNIKISYWINIFDESGNNESTEEFNFIYDGTAPEIKIKGDDPLKISINSTYEEFGAEAIDNIYGDLSSNIIIEGEVNTNVLGEYTINYTVSDLAGNTATEKRIVNVVEFIEQENSGLGSGGNNYHSDSKNNPNISNSDSSTNSVSVISSNSTDIKSNRITGTGSVILDFAKSKAVIGVIILILIAISVGGFLFFKVRKFRKLYGKSDKQNP